MQRFKKIPMKLILEQFGLVPSKVKGINLWYLSPFRNENTESFKINEQKNVWFDFGLGVGGNIFDFLERYKNFDLKASIFFLEGILGGSSFSSPKASLSVLKRKNVLKNKMEVEQILNVTHPALINYILGRGINVDIGRKYLKQIVYRNNKGRFFAIGMQNDHGGVELRNQYFKGIIGSKAITTIKGKEAEELLIFEGMVDFLSYLTLRKEPELTQDVIILNSVALAKKLEAVKMDEYKGILLFLDNDSSGRRLTQELCEKYSNAKPMNTLYPECKDLNDFLLSLRQL